jgi:hypothetical protein
MTARPAPRGTGPALPNILIELSLFNFWAAAHNPAKHLEEIAESAPVRPHR